MTVEKIVTMLKLFAMRPQPGDTQTITNPEAFHFALGSVLGDGSIHKRDKNLEMEQKSVTYALWKLKKSNEHGLISVNRNTLTTFRFMGKEAQLPLTMKKHKVRSQNLQNTKKGFYRSFSFVTRAVFHDPLWRDWFYSPVLTNGVIKYRKKLPENIKDLFYSPYALAIWYLDDGFYDIDKKTVRISVGEWTNDECLLMQECLEQNFGIETSLYLSNGVPHHLYVTGKSYSVFYSHVFPTIQELLQEYPKALISEGLKTKVRFKPPGKP